MSRPNLWEQLDQDEVWVDADGHEWPLEGMTPSHRANLLAWFYRQASALQRAWHMDFLGSGMPPADTVAFDMVMGGLMDDLGTTPEEWLQEQPLIDRLQELVLADQDAPATNGAVQ